MLRLFVTLVLRFFGTLRVSKSYAPIYLKCFYLKYMYPPGNQQLGFTLALCPPPFPQTSEVVDLTPRINPDIGRF
jgi:hypothetical protein